MAWPGRGLDGFTGGPPAFNASSAFKTSTAARARTSSHGAGCGVNILVSLQSGELSVARCRYGEAEALTRLSWREGTVYFRDGVFADPGTRAY